VTENQEDEKKGREDVRLVYELAGADSRFLKAQQWTVTYYVLVLYAAVFGVNDFLGNASLVEKVLLTAIAFFAFLAGCLYIQSCQQTLDRYRCWIKTFTDPKSQRLGECYKLHKEVASIIVTETDFDNQRHATVANRLMISLFLGFVVVTWALLRDWLMPLVSH